MARGKGAGPQPRQKAVPEASCARDAEGEGEGAGRGTGDEKVQLPNSLGEEGGGEVGMAKVVVIEQTQYWICCYCGKGDNPMYAASCQKALCGHLRGSHCARRWCDG